MKKFAIMLCTAIFSLFITNFYADDKYIDKTESEFEKLKSDAKDSWDKVKKKTKDKVKETTDKIKDKTTDKAIDKVDQLTN
ncbi:MAG: hypothetical protein AB8U25_00015 [Rickettsiales endosymbiont of Dermacentor nuttalli]